MLNQKKGLTGDYDNKKGNVQVSAQDVDMVRSLRATCGLGRTIGYVNELRAVQQEIGRLGPLQSSNLHEDVLRGNLNTISMSENLSLAEDGPMRFGRL